MVHLNLLTLRTRDIYEHKVRVYPRITSYQYE